MLSLYLAISPYLVIFLHIWCLCSQAYEQGARFAKWRNVLQLDPAKRMPTELAIADTVHTLARYASISQSEGLVPIVEPEIVPNGHSAGLCRGAWGRLGTRPGTLLVILYTYICVLRIATMLARTWPSVGTYWNMLEHVGTKAIMTSTTAPK